MQQNTENDDEFKIQDPPERTVPLNIAFEFVASEVVLGIAKLKPALVEFSSTPQPTESPWGAIQHAREIAPGIWCIGTASHGGYYLSAERVAAMPTALAEYQPFAGAQWYEEDIDWALVCLVFPEEFTANAPSTEIKRRVLAAALRIAFMRHAKKDPAILRWIDEWLKKK